MNNRLVSDSNNLLLNEYHIENIKSIFSPFFSKALKLTFQYRPYYDNFDVFLNDLIDGIEKISKIYEIEAGKTIVKDSYVIYVLSKLKQKITEMMKELRVNFDSPEIEKHISNFDKVIHSYYDETFGMFIYVTAYISEKKLWDKFSKSNETIQNIVKTLKRFFTLSYDEIQDVYSDFFNNRQYFIRIIIEHNVKKLLKPIFTNDNVTIYRVESQKECRALGADTRWCTASSSGQEHFDRYKVKTHLYIIFVGNRKYHLSIRKDFEWLPVKSQQDMFVAVAYFHLFLAIFEKFSVKMSLNDLKKKVMNGVVDLVTVSGNYNKKDDYFGVLDILKSSENYEKMIYKHFVNIVDNLLLRCFIDIKNMISNFIVGYYLFSKNPEVIDVIQEEYISLKDMFELFYGSIYEWADEENRHLNKREELEILNQIKDENVPDEIFMNFVRFLSYYYKSDKTSIPAESYFKAYEYIIRNAERTTYFPEVDKVLLSHEFFGNVSFSDKEYYNFYNLLSVAHSIRKAFVVPFDIKEKMVSLFFDVFGNDDNFDVLYKLFPYTLLLMRDNVSLSSLKNMGEAGEYIYNFLKKFDKTQRKYTVKTLLNKPNIIVSRIDGDIFNFLYDIQNIDVFVDIFSRKPDSGMISKLEKLKKKYKPEDLLFFIIFDDPNFFTYFIVNKNYFKNEDAFIDNFVVKVFNIINRNLSYYNISVSDFNESLEYLKSLDKAYSMFVDFVNKVRTDEEYRNNFKDSITKFLVKTHKQQRQFNLNDFYNFVEEFINAPKLRKFDYDKVFSLISYLSLIKNKNSEGIRETYFGYSEFNEVFYDNMIFSESNIAKYIDDDITKLILSDLKDMENQEFIDTMDKYFNIIKELKKYNNVNILQKIYKLLIDNLHKIEENISEETKNESFFYKLLFYADTLISNYGYIIDSYKSGFDSSTFLLVVLNHNNPDLYKDFINLEKELKYYNIKT